MLGCCNLVPANLTSHLSGLTIPTVKKSPIPKSSLSDKNANILQGRVISTVTGCGTVGSDVSDTNQKKIDWKKPDFFVKTYFSGFSSFF